MNRWTCDLCGADITSESPPHGFDVTLALDTVFHVSGPVTRDESSTRPNALRYLDWCLACRKKSLREAMAKEPAT